MCNEILFFVKYQNKHVLIERTDILVGIIELLRFLHSTYLYLNHHTEFEIDMTIVTCLN